MKRGESKTITIQVRIPANAPMAPMEIPAEVFGKYAVHRTLTPTGSLTKEDDFTVTHTPTGLIVADAFVDLTTARRFAEVMASILDVEEFDVVRHKPTTERELKRARGWL